MLKVHRHPALPAHLIDNIGRLGLALCPIVLVVVVRLRMVAGPRPLAARQLAAPARQVPLVRTGGFVLGARLRGNLAALLVAVQATVLKSRHHDPTP